MISSPSPALPSLPGANLLKAGVKAGPAEGLPAPAGSSAGTAPLDFSQVLDASAPAPTKIGGNALQAAPVEPAAEPAAKIPPAPAPESAAPKASPAEPSGKGGKILPGREKVAANAIREAEQNRSAEKPSGKTTDKISHGISGETPIAAPQMANSETPTPVPEPSLPENPQPAANTGTAGALALLQTRNARAPMVATAAPTSPSTPSPIRAAPPAAVPAVVPTANTGPVALPLQLPEAPPEGRAPNIPAPTGLPPSAQPVAMEQGRTADMPEVRLTAPVVAPGPAPMTATSEMLKAGARPLPEVTTAAVPQAPEAPVDAPIAQTPSAPMSVSSTATQDVPSAPSRPHDPEPATDPVTTAPLASAPAPTLAPTTAPTTIAPSPEAPQDFATLVQRLNEAREAVTPQVVQTALVHAEFGRVNLALRHEDGGLSVTMASLDPTFAPAVQAALAAGADTARERMQGEAQQQAPSRHGSEPRGESNQQRQDGNATSGGGSASAHGAPSGNTAASNSGQQQRDTARGNAAADTRPARNGGSGTGFPGSDTAPSSPRSGPLASGLYA
ncbi:hypothetical protein [Novosphingobium sp. 9]|uniref:hypothetical protein n=1 Tax=Novosphingobium sp. 9 TaxID=2025349 RepID=UPI0021B52ADD|nr:hypothetical protein [Novosphingobium sp. 9]